MKNLSRFFLIIIVLFIASCKCDETQTCEGLSEASKVMLPLGEAGSTFFDGSDSTINIFFRSSNLQESYAEDCASSNDGGCDCENCPDKNGKINYALKPIFSSRRELVFVPANTPIDGKTYPRDTSVFTTITRNEEFYVVNIDEDVNSEVINFELDFLGFSFIFDVIKQNGVNSIESNAQNANVEFEASFTTPEDTYSNVLVLDNEASRFSEKSPYLRKIYFTANSGVVAFESKQRKLFYLKK